MVNNIEFFPENLLSTVVGIELVNDWADGLSSVIPMRVCDITIYTAK